MSTIPGVNKSAFWFVKSLSKEEYDALQLVDGKRTFQCHFKANKRESATRVYVTNPYFVAYVDDILTSVTGLQPYDVDDFGNYEPRYFQNLDYTVDPIAIGTDKTTTFTFKMTAVPEGSVTVTLVNARPADGEEDLTGGTVDKDGNAVFVYNTNTTSGSFDLLTTTDDKAVEVRLAASHFVPDSRSADRQWMQFTGGNFAGRLSENAGDKVSYTFGIPSAGYTANMVVTVKLDGLAFDGGMPNNGRWTDKGNGVYEYRPQAAGNVTLNLVSTIAGERTDKVTVSAYGYKTLESTINQKDGLEIYNKTIKFSFNINHGTINQYVTSLTSITANDPSVVISHGSLTSSRNDNTQPYTFEATIPNLTITNASESTIITFIIRCRRNDSRDYTFTYEVNMLDLIEIINNNTIPYLGQK